jgi:hypothetical protein
MKLNTEQIEKLYQFTRQHYVEWYDLQTELVDHLANAIEQQWQENSKISFDDALQNEFKKFGVCGFMDVVEKRQASLIKRYNKIVWKLFKSFFSIPKFIITFLAVFLIFKLLINSENNAGIIIQTVLFISVFVFLITSIYNHVKYNKLEKKSGRKWLFKEIIFKYGDYLTLLNVPIQLTVLVENNLQINFYIAMLFSLFIVSVYLISYIILFAIPLKAKDYLRQTYPEYEFEKIN